MIRNLKALGLALVAVLAVGAMMASAAQAKSTIFATTSSSPLAVHATGEEIGEVFKIDGVAVTCKVSHYTGSVTNNSNTITITPSYTTCIVGGVVNLEITVGDCDYEFTGKNRVALDHYNATVSIKCVNSAGITIEAATCHMTVPPQNGLGIVTVKSNTAGKDLTITLNVSGIEGTVITDGFLCPFSGTGKKTGGTYTTEKELTITPTETLRSIQFSGS